jgi:hypothetical protein
MYRATYIGVHIAQATKCVSLNGKFVGKQTELLKGKVESDILAEWD